MKIITEIVSPSICALSKKARLSPLQFLTVFCVGFFLICLSPWTQAQTELRAPQWLTSEQYSNNGYFTLNWSTHPTASDKNIIYEVQKSSDDQFNNPVLLYKGADQQSFISGLNNGDYYYRVRSLLNTNASPWSVIQKVSVKHHSLTLSFFLFGVGSVVFLCILGTIWRGNRQEDTSHG